MLGVPTTNALIERLDVDKSLRRILGWERRAQVPSEATFSRAFAEFAQGDLPDKMHAALIERSLAPALITAMQLVIMNSRESGLPSSDECDTDRGEVVKNSRIPAYRRACFIAMLDPKSYDGA